MYIIRYYGECSIGDTIEDAITNFELDRGEVFDADVMTVYKAEEIEVVRSVSYKEKEE